MLVNLQAAAGIVAACAVAGRVMRQCRGALCRRAAPPEVFLHITAPCSRILHPDLAAAADYVRRNAHRLS